MSTFNKTDEVYCVNMCLVLAARFVFLFDVVWAIRLKCRNEKKELYTEYDKQGNLSVNTSKCTNIR